MPNTAPCIDDFSWLPEPALRKFTLYPGEVDVMRAKPKRTVSEYVNGERYVHVSPLPGPLDLDIAPYTRGIMDAYSEEHVREIFLCGGSQGAKTDTMHNCWAWAAVHAPRPALIVMQDRETGSETISDRFIPMIQDTPSLRRLRTKNPDDLSNKRVRLKNGMVTYLAWGKSEGRLASKPICYLFMDEVDLYPPSSIKKARARTRAFRHERKIVEACTASTVDGRIWQAQFHAQEIRDYYARCPHCGHYQTMKFERIRWGENIVDPQDVSEKGSAWYECEACEKPWDEDDRDEAVSNGEWRGRGKVRHLRPSSIWFHIPPMLSRFVFFNEIASSYLLTLLEPTEENFRNHYNDNLGFPVPVTDENEAVQEKELYGRREDYAPEGAKWRVPMAACYITADVDVQSNRLECEVVAWGVGDEVWGLEYKTFHGKPQEDEVWDKLHEYLQETKWRHESGVDLVISAAGVDLGYCSDKVSKFVRRSRRYIAHKGSNTRGLPLAPRKPSRGKYKVSFYELGTDTGKDLLFTWLNNTGNGPKRCHFPIGHGYDFEYFRMLCSEHGKKEKDRRTHRMVTVWQLRPGFSRNEALDIRVGNMAVMMIRSPNYAKLSAYLEQQALLLKANAKQKPVKPAPPKPEQPARHLEEIRENRALPSWRRGR